jgi:hypothetical protein
MPSWSELPNIQPETSRTDLRLTTPLLRQYTEGMADRTMTRHALRSFSVSPLMRVPAKEHLQQSGTECTRPPTI